MSMLNRRNVLLSLPGFMMPGISLPQSGQKSGQPAFTSTVEQALTVFLAAFEKLDWPAFRVCFASDATVFHPALPNIKRIDSPEAFENAWLSVFARIKKQSGRNAPQYMNLKPQDLRIEVLSPEVALATFHLIDGDVLCRRTILLKQVSDGWKIVHLHASNITATNTVVATAIE